jgi:hypothetical protein
LELERKTKIRSPKFFLGGIEVRARERWNNQYSSSRETDVIDGVASVVGRFPPNRHKGLKLLAPGMEWREGQGGGFT